MGDKDLLKKLQEEKETLKSDLEEIRTVYSQLIKENENEKFDERRVTLLKAQVMQLERQVMLLNESSSSRSLVIVEVNTALSRIADLARHYITKEVSGPEVPVLRSDLTSLVSMAEQMRTRLSKNIEQHERVSHPFLVPDKYVHPSREHSLSIMDICSPNLEHINLKHIGKLESRLCKLYKQLQSLQQSLKLSNQSQDSNNIHSNKPLSNRLSDQIGLSCKMCQECAVDLQDLSLLVPNAPWPPISKKWSMDITVDDVIKRLPNFPRNKQKEGRQVIECLIKATNYRTHIDKLQLVALNEELTFHQSVYQTQIKFTETLFKALKESYRQFEASLRETLNTPLQAILESYNSLASSASDVDLKLFLTTFKSYCCLLTEITDTLQHNEQENEVLTDYERKFHFSLEELDKTCKRNIARLTRDIDSTRSLHDEAKDELEQMFEAADDKRPDSICDKEVITYSKIVNRESCESVDKPDAGADGYVETVAARNDNRPVWDSSIYIPEGENKVETSDTANDTSLADSIDSRPPWDNSIITPDDDEAGTSNTLNLQKKSAALKPIQKDSTPRSVPRSTGRNSPMQILGSLEALPKAGTPTRVSTGSPAVKKGAKTSFPRNVSSPSLRSGIHGSSSLPRTQSSETIVKKTMPSGGPTGGDSATPSRSSMIPMRGRKTPISQLRFKKQ